MITSIRKWIMTRQWRKAQKEAEELTLEAQANFEAHRYTESSALYRLARAAMLRAQGFRQSIRKLDQA